MGYEKKINDIFNYFNFDFKFEITSCSQVSWCLFLIFLSVVFYLRNNLFQVFCESSVVHSCIFIFQLIITSLILLFHTESETFLFYVAFLLFKLSLYFHIHFLATFRFLTVFLSVKFLWLKLSCTEVFLFSHTCLSF